MRTLDVLLPKFTADPNVMLKPAKVYALAIQLQ